MPQPLIKRPENKYIEIVHRENLEKTAIFEIISKSSGSGLGLIKWYGAWRQYTFQPYEGTIWNHECLECIRFTLIAFNECQKENRLKINHAATYDQKMLKGEANAN